MSHRLINPRAAGALLVLALAAFAAASAEARPLQATTRSLAAAGGGLSSSSSSVSGPHVRRRALLQEQQQDQQEEDEGAAAKGYDLASAPPSPAKAEEQEQHISFAGTSIDPVTHKVTANGRASAVSGPAHIPKKATAHRLLLQQEEGSGREGNNNNKDAASSLGYLDLGEVEHTPQEKEKEAQRADLEFALIKIDVDTKEVKAGAAHAGNNGRRLLL